mmetsp:Transcript_30735/g.45491  ORF Transcript_30735/g.45491 Transcript_30735/m.45491 type:complete len:486 (+) Transcript_30735:55-1512(+)|eukprot:CAMPEP_0195526670 /NCGR_PEP_ID=MMETSP0794_2-20130614/27882_1 /TAXON_ID=515487 /ORGANISM="Stephanopyxis turris, Strain CCMP 815" /LENGTH=485 /DNA_ID=CAMNT_0040657415 /DNA_START=55 /DNA_END=1512 /DNA_ORIENTATION=-
MDEDVSEKYKTQLMEPMVEPAEAEKRPPSFYLCNAVHMSSCFLLVFTSFSAIQNLAGSYFFDSLGFIGGTVLYITFAVSCLFGPLIGAKLGAKWSLFCGFLGYTVYTGCAMVTAMVFVATKNESAVPQEACVNGSASANLTKEYCYNTQAGWGIELFGTATCGFCASFLWYAEGVYITRSAKKYSEAVVRSSQGEKTPKDAAGFFNGIFFGFFQITQILGNLVGGLLFSAGWSFPNICLVYLVFAVAGAIVCFFLRAVNSAEERQKEAAKSVADRLKGPVALLVKDMRLPLLVPYMIYSGMEMVFIWSDFTANYVKPVLGGGDIGFLMAVFGASDAAFSLLVGKLSDVVGQLPMVLVGFAAQAAVLLFFQFYPAWSDTTETATISLYVCAGVWGLGDAVANTVMYAIVGRYFDSGSEVGDAFANLKLWQSVACAAAFAYSLASDDFSKEVRRFGILGCLVISAIAYIILATWQGRKKVSPLPNGE